MNNLANRLTETDLSWNSFMPRKCNNR